MFTAAAPVGAVSTHSRFSRRIPREFSSPEIFPHRGIDMNRCAPRTLSTASCWRAFSDGDDLEEGSSSERPAKQPNVNNIVVCILALAPTSTCRKLLGDVEGSGAPALRALAILSRLPFCSSPSFGAAHRSAQGGHGCSDGSIRRFCGGDGGPGGALSAARTLLTR